MRSPNLQPPPYPSLTAFLTTGGLHPVSLSTLPPSSLTCVICSRAYSTTSPPQPHDPALPSPKLPEHPVKLPCGHVFGLDCVLRWLDGEQSEGANDSCPLCRCRLFLRGEGEVEEEWVVGEVLTRGGHVYEDGRALLAGAGGAIGEVDADGYLAYVDDVLREYEVPLSPLFERPDADAAVEDVRPSASEERDSGRSATLFYMAELQGMERGEGFHLSTSRDPGTDDELLREFNELFDEEIRLESALQQSQFAMERFLHYKAQWMKEHGNALDRVLQEEGEEGVSGFVDDLDLY